MHVKCVKLHPVCKKHTLPPVYFSKTLLNSGGEHYTACSGHSCIQHYTNTCIGPVLAQNPCMRSGSHN